MPITVSTKIATITAPSSRTDYLDESKICAFWDTGDGSTAHVLLDTGKVVTAVQTASDIDAMLLTNSAYQTTRPDGSTVYIVAAKANHVQEDPDEATDCLIWFEGGGFVRSGTAPATVKAELETAKKVVAFTDADATPSVKGGRVFKTANTGATTITMLDDGTNGDVRVIIIGDANTTIDFTGTNLKGNAGVDWTPASGDHMICVFDGTDWYCAVSDNTA